MTTAAFNKFSDLLYLDKETGALYWKHPKKGRTLGKPAGVITNKGYRVITLDYKQYQSSRIVWLLHTGSWPINEIDHINRIESDDRPINLRDATRTINNRNRGKFLNNTSGYTGIIKMASGKWRVTRYKKNRGTYASLELAIKAYDEAE